MKFQANHYVPILKMKGGEKEALQGLSAAVVDRMTPLLEVVVRKQEKSSAAHIDTSFKKLDAAVAPFQRYFLDCREIAPDGPTAVEDVFRRAADLGPAFTPVTGLSRSADVTASLAFQDNGIAIRLTRDEFESGRIPSELPAFLQKHGISHDTVDLIIDLGAVDDMVVQGIEGLTEAFLADVPDHSRWRTMTVSACAFPLSMGVVGRNSFALVERAEWQAWKNALHARRGTLTRLPTFSDCSIQHPTGVEDFDARIMQGSAAIRYTLAEQWLLIKGIGTRSVPPSQQFPELAKQLVYGHLSGHYATATHCAGCDAMRNAANGAPKLGSLGVWRRLATIHHITRAVEELDALPWP